MDIASPTPADQPPERPVSSLSALGRCLEPLSDADIVPPSRPISSATPPPAARSAGPPPSLLARSRLTRFNYAVDAHLRVFFYRLGFRVARSPWRTIAVTTALAVFCLLGALRLETDFRSEELYIPDTAPANAYRRYVEDRFGPTYRVNSLLFRPREGARLATVRAMLDVVRVAESAFDAQGEPVPRPRGDGSPNDWAERCVKGFDDLGKRFCLTISALDVFYSANLPTAARNGSSGFFPTVQAQIEGMSDDDVENRLLNGPFKSWSGLPYNERNFIAVEDGKVVAIMLHAPMYRGTEIRGDFGPDDEADSFDRAWMSSLDKHNNNMSLSVTALSDCSWSRHESSQTALRKDLPLFAFGFILLMIYVCAVLGELHPVYSRVGLGLVAMVTCGLAVAVTFGLSSLLKLTFGSIHYMLLLLLFGIGIDDIMVVTKSLTRVDRKLHRDSEGKDIPHKIGEAMSDAGVSVSATTVTNVAVFAVSASTSIGGLRSFALWAAIGVAATFIYTTTFFVAALTLDQLRIEKGKRDVYCLYTTATKISDKNAIGVKFQPFSRFFKAVLGPFILHRSVSIALLVLFSALAAVGIWGTSRIFVKFDLWFLFMFQTPAWSFTKTFQETFKTGEPASVYIRDIDFSAKSSQQLMIELCHPENGTIAQNKWVEKGSVFCWFHMLRQYNNLTNTDQVFDSRDFNSTFWDSLDSNQRLLYTNDFALRQDWTIEASRFRYTRKYVSSVEEKVQAMLDIREELKQILSGEEVFSFTMRDVLAEQFAILAKEIGLSLGLACGAVFVICIILSGHPMIAVICLVLVSLLVVDLVGFIHFSGYNLNGVTSMTLTVSVGIGVDFILHVARSFQDQVGFRKERAIMALHDLGPSVFHAGFSTFLSICIPGMSRSYVFRAIFWGLFALLILAALHGLVLGPVLLALIGPQGWFESEEEKILARKDIFRRAVMGLTFQSEDHVGADEEHRDETRSDESDSREDGIP